MVLLIHEPPEHIERVLARSPDAATIRDAVNGLTWSDLTFVTVKRDNNNWLEGSGSLNPEDGLSARYMANGEEHVAARAPNSLNEIVALLQSFAASDGRWRQLIEWD